MVVRSVVIREQVNHRVLAEEKYTGRRGLFGCRVWWWDEEVRSK